MAPRKTVTETFADILMLQVLNWAMDALRWAQVLQFGLGKHNYQITDATFQSFGKVYNFLTPLHRVLS